MADGQWYLHLFDKAQPDVNWKNPDIHEEFKKTLRFWSDHGTDGFRIDVAHAWPRISNPSRWKSSAANTAWSRAES